ncbi:hypothetical protein H312_00834 [Anncaliia algerae PRA339]|uniref:Exocyst complex component Sec6 n=1 Tax=Anncaliia algerae PRA339 TaxID=1288291 RepID=A0A059F466_9MICR|nr:hypothetical protein H312_00834 [Anncaliia algerae PRA339]
MDEAIKKINSDEKFDLSELKKQINNLQNNYHTLNNKLIEIQKHNPLLINHTKLTTLLPEQTLIISTAYKNLLFVYNSSLRLKNIKNECNEIYPIEYEKIKEQFIKYQELFKFKEQLRNYNKLECIDKLGLDLEVKVIKYNLFEQIEFIEQINYICDIRKDWKDKLIKETKNKVILRIPDYEKVLNDFSKIPELKNEIIDKRELIEFYFDKLKENIRNKLQETDISKLLSLFEFEHELKLINDSNFIYLPHLLDNKYELITKYVKYSEENIEAWMNNVKKSIFNSRNQPPPVDEHNKFICTDFINLLELIKNQIEPIKFSKEIRENIEKILVEGVKSIIDGLINLLQNEFSAAVNLKGPPGYEEYVVMISNSSLKLAQFANDSLESKVLSDLFVELMESCNSILCNFVVFTCKPIFNLIFTDKWYEREKSVIPTLNDFVTDYKKRMNDYNFYKLIVKLSEKISEVYFSQIKRNRAKLYDDVSYILKKDILEIEELFYKNDVEVKMEQVRVLKELLENEGEAFLTEVIAVKDVISKEVVVSIIRKRSVFIEKDEYIKKVKRFYGSKKEEKGLFEKIFG